MSEMNSLNHCSIFTKTLFTERRKWEYGLFFDGSKMTKRQQSLLNRLACMKEIVEPWMDQEMSDNEIRILMKKSFF